MKIVSLSIANVKRVVAVHIDPTGNIVEISGKNGQGKTSVLDSIWWALAGAEHVQSAPINKDANTASIVIRLKGDDQELIVTRKFVRKEGGEYTTALSVKTPQGARYDKAQTFLNDLVGALSFDPLEFSRMKPREQYDELRKFVPGVDFAAIDGKNADDFERRREINKDAARARAAADLIVVPAGVSTERIDENALTDELQRAGEQNADVERRLSNRAQAARDVETNRNQAQQALDKIAPALADIESRHKAAINGFDQQIAALERQRDAAIAQLGNDLRVAETKLRDEAAGFTAKADEVQAQLDAAPKLPAIIDTKAIAERISQARASNAVVERVRQRAAHVAEAEKHEAAAQALTDAIGARNAEKQKAIAAAQMPVPGLGFGDGVVLLNGFPFDQASDAERLRTSVAIAMALNPKLRVIRIRDGSLFDTDAMKVLDDMCKEKDFQCWIERVSDDGSGFVIENGHLRGAAQADAA